MERRKFIGTLTTPVITACAVCLGACSKSSSGSTSGTTAASVDFNLDLSTSLLTVGSSVVKDSVIVVRLAAGNTASSFTAVQVNCTHEGTSINYNAQAGQFVCPNHGSTFTTSGAVTLGPASKALKLYNVVVNGTSLRVSG
jgi:cytochrome b6-f complex iron-sulfur subunit